MTDLDSGTKSQIKKYDEKRFFQNRFVFAVLLASLFLGLLNPRIGNAQSTTNIQILPTETSIIADTTTTINVFIENAMDMNGYEIEITYDSSLLTLVTWTDGPLLKAIWHPAIINTPGLFRIPAVQLAQPGVNGDGVIFSLTFLGESNGTSPITITYAELIDKMNVSFYPSRNNGSILVHSDPATVPTRTVTGSFSLQGQPSATGIPIEFGFGQNTWLGPYTGTTSAFSPNFSLPNVVEDTYPITINLPRYLSLTEYLSKKFTVSSSSTVMPPLMLYGGNAIWQDCVDDVCTPNNIIDAADVSLVGAQYLQSGPGLDGDVNYSGRVDIFDLAMVGANYGLTSKDVYATWLP